MPADAWKRLLAGAPWSGKNGRFTISAYSEFVPPVWLGPKPYGTSGLDPRVDDDPLGWGITEYEESFEFQPGLTQLAHCAVGRIVHLGRGERGHGIAHGKLVNNPFWPDELAKAAGQLPHEHYTILMSLALSRTLDDKGRIRWSFFGSSEQGPAAAFWKSYQHGPRASDVTEGHIFLTGLLQRVYGATVDHHDLAAAGFRILPMGPASGGWSEGPLPKWTRPLILQPRESLSGVKYLLTFRPFANLPAGVRKAYLAGELHLLPFPGSLVFWGTTGYRRLQRQLPFAQQIPLLHLFPRHEDPHGIRVPQSGWLHEKWDGAAKSGDHHGPIRNTYKRSHRWERIHRHEDELRVTETEDPLAHVLFSTQGKDLGLYGKPMARNAQIWTEHCDLLLDGPKATVEEIARVADILCEGGRFGYRFLFPAMRVGAYEVYWQRPLCAYLDPETGHSAMLDAAPTGYLTGYKADQPDLDNPIVLWPHFLQRPGYTETMQLFDRDHDERPFQTARNVRKLLDVHRDLPEALSPQLARRLLTVPKRVTLDQWLDGLPNKANNPEHAATLVENLRSCLHLDEDDAEPPAPITYGLTANREFEVEYWETIASLATGEYLTKNNADCVRDEPTKKELIHQQRDLDALGDHLLRYYETKIADAGLRGKALAGDFPFEWTTDFPFPWMGGWVKNQKGEARERDIVVVIPGRDRSRAVIMADHYDTAYMVDRYDPKYGGDGARLAAHGADDNHSATVAMMLAAPIFLAMSHAGKLGCDVWLVHLTGEEFPADCLGARALIQRLVEGKFGVRLTDGTQHDLSRTRVQGVYVMDMIAHNNDHDRDIFQIAPGVGVESLWLAWQAHLAAEAWNAGTEKWNRSRPTRRGKRSPDGTTIPATARHPQLEGQVRLPYDPHSTLYNTDGLIFSDAGVPVVLFMENYDINRQGYHDMHDTMENIDLDYGAAVAAIAIESVARAATETPPF
jgi:hypothetical protein